MRFRHPDGSTVHLAYCSNVHPAEDLDGVVGQLGRFAEPVRRSLDWPLLGVGLWLAAPVAHELASNGRALRRLRAELDRRRLEVVTLNGFPYQAFHAEVVKGGVYRPDWTESERLVFTLELAAVLHRLLPDDAVEGSISTVPLGWRTRDLTAALPALERLTEGLAKQAADAGRPVRVAIEPEPGCAVETLAQAAEVLACLSPDWLGVCVDACHVAVQFEEPRLADMRVVKAQLSSALRVREPSRSPWLSAFAEPRFLHQVRERQPGGSVVGVDDLGEALGGGLPGEGEWRVHFHVPIHAGGERTTQEELVATMAALVGGSTPATHHLEVETYTWTVLPVDQRPQDDQGLVAGLARELRWARDRFVDLGLEEEIG